MHFKIRVKLGFRGCGHQNAFIDTKNVGTVVCNVEFFDVSNTNMRNYDT